MRGMHLAAAAVVALGTSAITPATAQAQATATPSPFHAGQWGLEAYAAGQMGGVMRFLTPRTALVLTMAANHYRTSAANAGSTIASDKATEVDATLGVRRHTTLAPRLSGIFDGGAVAGTFQQRREYTGSLNPGRYHAAYYGAYADAGGQYMVADHFAVGIAYRLIVRHIRNDASEQAGTEFISSVLPVRATLYF